VQLYHTWIVILLRTASTRIKSADLDTVFDGYTSEFEEMLNFAEAIIKDHYATMTPLVSFDMGVVPPINFVALKCRVLRLRRKAIDILKQAPKQEGLWRRETVVRYAEWKLQTEEEERGSTPESEPLPQCARIVEKHRGYKEVDGMRIPRWEFKKGFRESDASEPVDIAVEKKIVEGLADIL
jgi:hypothetical protein